MKETSAEMLRTREEIPSPRISEIVLRTSRFAELRTWYQLVLSAKPSFEYVGGEDENSSHGRVLDFQQLCFLRVHTQFPYTQVLALFEVPGLKRDLSVSGLHHMQFRTSSMDELADRHDHLSDAGILPYKSYNHGSSISFYYEDPDGNLVELAAPCYSTEEEYIGFFQTEGFKANPTGVQISAKEFISALRSGTDRRSLVRLPS